MTRPLLSITLSPAEVVYLNEHGWVELAKTRCANCGGDNVEMREDADPSVGYRADVLYCKDCGGRGD